MLCVVDSKNSTRIATMTLIRAAKIDLIIIIIMVIKSLIAQIRTNRKCAATCQHQSEMWLAICITLTTDNAARHSIEQDHERITRICACENELPSVD